MQSSTRRWKIEPNQTSSLTSLHSRPTVLATTIGVRRQKHVTLGLPPTRKVIISRPLGAQELKKLITNYWCT